MSEMTQREAVERFSEGLKKAASRARELKMHDVAMALDSIRQSGMKIIESRAISRSDALRMIDKHIEKAKETVN